MSATAADGPLQLEEVLEAEHAHLQEDAPDQPPRNQCAYSALCLSGGGIRSASFALGVIQALGAKGLLRGFDYLSTVSGGGYTGGWLAGWLHHTRLAGSPSVFDQLRGSQTSGNAVEPEPVAQVRANSRFLSPAAGFFSADLWTLIATIARNLFLNWLVLLPLIGAALLTPVLYHELLSVLYKPVVNGAMDQPWGLAYVLFLISGALITVSAVHTILNLPSYGNRGSDQRTFLVFNCIPLCIAVIGITLMMVATERDKDNFPLSAAAIGGAMMGGFTWTAVGLLSRTRRWRPQTAVAGAMSGAIITAGVWFLARILKSGDMKEAQYATIAFPLVLGVLVVAGFVFIGMAGADIDDNDLEWHSRNFAWFLMVGTAWLLVCLLVLSGPEALRKLSLAVLSKLGLSEKQVPGAIGIVTSGLGALAAFAGRSMGSPISGKPSRVKHIAFALAAPAFAVLLLAALASVNDWLVPLMRNLSALAGNASQPDNRVPEVLLLGAAYVGAGLLMGYVVPVNKFSLHGMYRSRLIRTFLGASRDSGRTPNPFTGFDDQDNVGMSELKHLRRPFLVVNMTLNKVAQSRGGRLQRQAESFTATPLHVGSASLGYRPADRYGSNPRLGRQGISLGTAMTISGAAASPNMGAHSTPALTFLLTLFNARLGTWLGNPGAAGKHSWLTDEPRNGAGPILSEMLGLTTNHSPYVLLSDGGHFDNLGLWEMIQRRCRYILVSDAGCDPNYTFESLATAIRQVRIDHGVPIEFDRGCPMDSEHQGKGNPHVAVGRIRYREVDPDVEDGILLYVKATLCGQEPIDVITYGKRHPSFPHESTANQWFGEAQFESYRMLGVHSIMHMAEHYREDGDVPGFFAWVVAADTSGPAHPVTSRDDLG